MEVSDSSVTECLFHKGAKGGGEKETDRKKVMGRKLEEETVVDEQGTGGSHTNPAIPLHSQLVKQGGMLPNSRGVSAHIPRIIIGTGKI